MIMHKLRPSGLKSFDVFGKSINFTFKQDTQFRTTIGGVATVLCGIVFLIMFTIKTAELAGKTDPFLFMLEVQSTSDEIDLY